MTEEVKTISEKTPVTMGLIITAFGFLLIGAVRVETINGRSIENSAKIAEVEKKNEELAKVIVDVRLSLVAIKTHMGIKEQNEIQNSESKN